MAIDLRQNLKLTQQLLMTPQLQQAIKLLQLSRVELEDYIAQQLAENPFLEEGEGTETAIVEKSGEDAFLDQVDQTMNFLDSAEKGEKTATLETFDHTKESNEIDNRYVNRQTDSINYENMISNEKTLSQHLLDQVGEISLSSEEQAIAKLLIGNIGDTGFLDVSLQEIADQGPFDLELVEGVLDTLQRLDPPGIAARTMQECLLLQLREKKLKNGVIEMIIENHLDELQKQHYGALAKKLNLTQDQLVEHLAILADLDPIPARNFGSSRAEAILPDVVVFKVGPEWVVSLQEDGWNKLQISAYYQELVRGEEAASDKSYFQEKLRSANWLLKSLHQRQRTILRVAEKIVERQRGFFEVGIQALKPMILKDVADELGLHESTVSRVTHQKYLECPRGVFELRYFFNSSIRTEEGDVASQSVKERIKALVGKESGSSPLSDQKLVALLEQEGIKVARRTVAKYREQMHILPSSKRTKGFSRRIQSGA